jgi:hypothetical protein
MTRLRHLALSLLFTATLFLSSALLFFVQPLFAKLVLPTLGGTPGVWNTCMVFFQTALLAGYAYAHLTPALLGVRLQALAHLALLAVPLALLPFGDVARSAPPAGATPVVWLLTLLLTTVGLPFFVVAASGPLLQKWFAHTDHPAARDPYFLYAASNLGSLLALLGYPLVVEPALLLTGSDGRPLLPLLHTTDAAARWPLNQVTVWAAGYVALLILFILCASAVRRPAATKATPAGSTDEPTPSALRRLRWVALAFVPSSWMLSVTTYLTTDIAAIPLLWVVPLALYLLTFILAFGRRRLIPRRWVRQLQPLLAVMLAVVFLSEATEPVWLLVSLHLAGFTVAALWCHGELAGDRPAARHLTEFYLWLSVGGALGGLFNGLLAPVVFSGLLEYPLILVLAALLRCWPRAGAPRRELNRADLVRPALLGVGTALLVLVLQALGLPPGQLTMAVVFGPSAVVCYTFVDHPSRYAFGLAALLMAGHAYHGIHGRPLYRERSFFGVHRVNLDGQRGCHLLVHGNTVHGMQFLDPDKRRQPLTYYHPDGPIGRIFRQFSGPDAKPHVAVVGLGAGSLAAYGEPGQHFTFYEIDPMVARIARDPTFFTFLADCPAQVEIELGDARLTLADAPNGRYGLLVIDAFSSDAIPLHLLTREALGLYLTKLADDGVLAFHISNRYLELAPVLANLAADAGLLAFGRDDLSVSEEEAADGKSPSRWVILVRDRNHLGSAARKMWFPLRPDPSFPLFTDSYSNLLRVFQGQ